MTINHLLTDRSLTFYVGATPYQVDRSVATFSQIVAEINKPQPDEARLVELANTVKAVQASVAKAASHPIAAQYLPKGVLSVTRVGITFNGEDLEGPIADRLRDVLEAGLNIAPWVRFVENLFMNPADHAREELLLWLEKADLPITNDGHFLAYKRVRPDYKDIHSGTFDNSVGQIVQLSGRESVDADRARTCSVGLHFCSKDYLPHFSSSGDEDHVMIVKVNPADVVSIPSDYSNTKGRTWRYEVVDEIPLSEIPVKSWEPVYNYDDADYDYDYDDEPYEALVDEDALYEETYDAAVAKYQAMNIVALRPLASKAGLNSAIAWKVYSKSQLADFLANLEAERAVEALYV